MTGPSYNFGSAVMMGMGFLKLSLTKFTDYEFSLNWPYFDRNSTGSFFAIKKFYAEDKIFLNVIITDFGYLTPVRG